MAIAVGITRLTRGYRRVAEGHVHHTQDLIDRDRTVVVAIAHADVMGIGVQGRGDAA